MGREKKKKPQAIVGGPKERHRRIPKSQFDPKAPMPTGFVAKPAHPQSKSKHHTYFEFVENKNKKKKLEFQVAAGPLLRCASRIVLWERLAHFSAGDDQVDTAARLRVRSDR
jgi:hypothetical protein